MLDFKPQSLKTDINNALEFLLKVAKRKCTTFLISDFYIRGDFSDAMTICSKKHDLVAIQVYDRCAKELPDVGLMKVKDAETGHEMYIDTSSKKLRQAHKRYWLERQTALNEMFNKSKTDSISVTTDGDYVKALLQLFAMRN